MTEKPDNQHSLAVVVPELVYWASPRPEPSLSQRELKVSDAWLVELVEAVWRSPPLEVVGVRVLGVAELAGVRRIVHADEGDLNMKQPSLE